LAPLRSGGDVLSAMTLRSLREESGAWVRWWVAELLGLLPEAWRQGFQLGRDDLVLVSDREGCRVERRGLGRQTSLAAWPCGDDDGPTASVDPDTLAELAKVRGECRVVLELADRGQILQRDILLPLAAVDNLGSVLGYEMDRHTPFTAAQVFHGHRVLARRPATAQVQVRLLVIPRTRLETALLRAEGWGLYPDRVVAAGEPEIDLLPADHRRARRRLPRANAWLAAAVVVLAGLLVLTPLWIMRDINLALNAQMQRLQPQALEVERLRARRDQLEFELNRLIEKKAEYPALVDSLSELARILPDHSWLSNLQYANHRFVVQGQSQSASGLIALIEASPYFERSAFVAPVSRDAYGLDNFQLSTDVRRRERMQAGLRDDPVPVSGAPTEARP
jgi:general secretion pathway protein L